jgi:ABC-type Fe3+-hydroxamate transport system substrate-binding protein
LPHIQSIDQLGNLLEINFPPRRIISLVPSQTEFLFDIGLDSEICAVTRFCIRPSDKTALKEKIGGTKRFDIEKIHKLKPHLLIGNKEENYLEGIDELKKHYPVWMSNIFSLADAYGMMEEVSRITGRQTEGEKLLEQIRTSFEEWEEFKKTEGNVSQPRQSCAYFIWRKPYMVAASDTFINHMLQVFGLSNVFAHLSRYPELSAEQIASATPDYVLLSSEPYSFSEKHFAEFSAFFPNAKIMLVNGEMFSWYGSRLRFTVDYFKKLSKSLF